MPASHVIGRLTVEIALSGPEQAAAHQHEISAWARSDALWRALSQALDELVPAGEVLTIPRLELTVEASSEAVFQAQLRRALTQAIGQVLQRGGPAARRSQAQYTEQLAWHFLTSGVLPSTAPRAQGPAVAAFLNQLPQSENEAFVRRLRAASAARPSLWQRLVYTIGIEKAQRLVVQHGHFSAEQATELHLLAAAAELQSRLKPSSFWFSVFSSVPAAAWEPAEFQEVLRRAAALADPSSTLPAPSANSQNSDVEDTDTELPAVGEPAAESYFVPNAGLVLLSQFLPQLFRHTHLLAGDDFRDEDARHQAIHLLHYLATGQTEAYEYDLLLAKLLCHCPLHGPVPRWVPLAEADLAQADALLHAVIQQWSVLRNTSAAGLRETFLQRPGMLSVAPVGGWRLHVERKTVDILLGRLPMGWGYSVVSLPWLPDLIFVEW